MIEVHVVFSTHKKCTEPDSRMQNSLVLLDYSTYIDTNQTSETFVVPINFINCLGL